MSTEKIYQKTLEIITRETPNLSGRHLDIGSGTGQLTTMIQSKYGVDSYCCDYTDCLLENRNAHFDIVNLNHQDLPYEKNYFDLVTCTEVVEHVENYRKFFRDVHRVIKPGGLVIFSTPNILNITSRFRFLTFGFWDLFGPLHVRESRLYTAGGHISPVSMFYFVHALLDAGFINVECSVDKYRKSGLLPLGLSWVPLKVLFFFSFIKEKNKYKTIDKRNEQIVRNINRHDILLGRTLMVSASKENP
jgi:ubiquinone/menaquinone biosynthesis C-methylase UbiE